MKILALEGQNGQTLYVIAENIATFYEFISPVTGHGTVIFMVGAVEGIGVVNTPENVADLIGATLQ